MSVKDDLRRIATTNSKDKNELQEKSDKLLSQMYKDMYQYSAKGLFEMEVSMAKGDWDVYRKAFDSLEEEGFILIPIESFTLKRHNGLWKISWEK